jgi:protein-S-isoprenylcysteine O-methyltransferase Ste14
METRKHKNRKDLIGEHKIGDAGQMIFAVLFFVVWITDTFILEYSVFLNEIIPNSVRLPVALAILILSAYLSISGLTIIFGEVREKPEVVRKGVFGIVRHPIYLSEILVYIGLLFVSLSIASAIICVMAIIFLYFISRYEEKILLEHFGEDYKLYMQDVPMWIPKIFSFIRKHKQTTN